MTSPAQWPAALAARPVCPRRQLPIPFIAEIGPGGVGEFTILDHHQAMACLRGRLCAMCGDPMDGEVALIGDVVSLEDPDGFFIEPPVHEVCGQIATGGLCPFLSHQRVPRRPVQENVALVGTDEAGLHCVGRGTAKRPVVMAIARGYYAGHVPSATGSPVLAYRPEQVLRVRRYAWHADRLTEITHPLYADPPRPLSAVERERWKQARTQPRRRPRSKR